MTMHTWKEPSGRKQFPTVAARLNWSYANLAMAHAALKKGAEKYGPFPYFQIRAKLYAGLNSGSMTVGSLFEDERLKMLSSANCAYCGVSEPRTADHLMPRVRGGDHRGENLVPCCAQCNSSKGGKDVMAWHRTRLQFPSLSITRRYLKLAMVTAGEAGLWNAPIESGEVKCLPFDVLAVPMNYPQPSALVWAIGVDQDCV